MQRTQTTCLVILTTLAIGFSLFYLKTVLLPFVISLFVVIACRPVLELLETKLKLHRFLAFIVSFLIGLALILGFVSLTWYSIDKASKNSADYEQRLNALITRAAQLFPEKEKEQDVEKEQDAVGEQDRGGHESEQSSEVPTETPRELTEKFFTTAATFMQSQVLSLASSASSLLSYGILILIFVFFLLLGSGTEQGKRIGIVGEIESQIRKYLVMKTVISIFTGLAFGSVLWFFDAPLAILFGFLAFLLNYIPNIGPLAASVLPVPFLALNSAISPTSAITCFLLIVTIQFISGNVIETRIMGKSFDVSPVVLLLALMFFGLIWGIIGMFLATPMVSIFKIVLQQRESTRKFADLLAGRLDLFDHIVQE